MTTSARTWFYTTPEPRPYYIEERVNQTLWKHRLQGLFMSCTQAEAPIRMEGRWNEVPIVFEWKPGDYFILKSGQERKELIAVIRQILMIAPAFSYDDPDGMHVVEWHTDGGMARWKSVQGDPRFQALRRLKLR
jgi:hypothetical protein